MQMFARMARSNSILVLGRTRIGIVVASKSMGHFCLHEAVGLDWWVRVVETKLCLFGI
jgi:hypothetical protein